MRNFLLNLTIPETHFNEHDQCIRIVSMHSTVFSLHFAILTGTGILGLVFSLLYHIYRKQQTYRWYYIILVSLFALFFVSYFIALLFHLAELLVYLFSLFRLTHHSLLETCWILHKERFLTQLFLHLFLLVTGVLLKVLSKGKNGQVSSQCFDLFKACIFSLAITPSLPFLIIAFLGPYSVSWVILLFLMLTIILDVFFHFYIFVWYICDEVLTLITSLFELA